MTTYELTITEYSDRLFRKLKQTTDAFNIKLALSSFTFSSIASIAFSATSDFIEKPEGFEPVMRGFATGNARMLVLGTVAYLNEPMRAVLDRLPKVLRPKFFNQTPIAFAFAMLGQRLAQDHEPARPDLITCLSPY